LADLGTLAATDAGKYAAILAAIAEMAASPDISSPVPAIVSQLVADIQDGIIDGLDLYGVGIADLIYNAPTFQTDFSTALDGVTTGTPLDVTDFGTVNVNVGVLPDNGDTGVDLSGTIINPNSLPGDWELFVDGVVDNEGQLESGPVSYNDLPVNSGSSYEVKASNEECMVSNATGTVADVDITNIDITCP